MNNGKIQTAGWTHILIPQFEYHMGMRWRCRIMVKPSDSDKSIKMGGISKDYNGRAVL